MFDNDLGELIGVVCEGVVYGIYIVLFLLSLVFLYGARRTQTNKLMGIFTSLLFVLCTLHFSLEFNHFYRTLESSGVENFANETKELFAADILVSTIDFIGDLVLLHRCWLVWGKNYFVVILPFLTALAGFVCAMTGLGILNNTDPDAPQAPAAIVPLGTAAFALPLATNFLITISTVIRLYMLAAKARRINTTNALNTTPYVHKAAAIVIESGLIYLIAQLILVILFSIGHPAQNIVAVVACQIYGIAPTLISFRVGLGTVTEDYELSSARRSGGTSWRLSSRRDGMPSSHTGISIHTVQEVAAESLTDFSAYKDKKDFRLGDGEDFRQSRMMYPPRADLKV